MGLSKIWIFLLWFAVPFASSLDDVLPKGVFRFETWFDLSDANRYFGTDERPVGFGIDGSPADYERRHIGLEIAYGWHPDITLILRSSHDRLELANQQATVDNSGIPTVYLGVRQRLNQPGAGFRIIGETGVSLPESADQEDPLPLESGGIDWFVIMSYGQEFYPTRGGVEMDFGYRFRNESPDDEIFFDAKLRLDFLRFAKTSFSYSAYESKDGSQTAYSVLEYPNNRGGQSGGISLSRRIAGSWEVEVGYAEMLHGRNQFESSGWRLSLSWRR